MISLYHKLLTALNSSSHCWRKSGYLEFEAEDFVQLSELPKQKRLPTKRNAWMLGQPSWTSVVRNQKALEEARNERWLVNHLGSHDCLSNEVVKTLLGAVDNNVAQLLIVSELTITERGSAPEGAVTFSVAFTVERAAGEVCDRCRRIDQQRLNVTTQPSVITVQASSKKILRTQSQKDLKLNKSHYKFIKELLLITRIVCEVSSGKRK